MHDMPKHNTVRISVSYILYNIKILRVQCLLNTILCTDLTQCLYAIDHSSRVF